MDIDLMRWIVGVLLIAVGLFKVWLTWAHIHSYRVKFARWFGWPPQLEWQVAMVYFSVARLLIILGLLVIGGTGPLTWWAIAMVLDVTVWHIVLAWGLWRMPSGTLARPDLDHVNHVEQVEP